MSHERGMHLRCPLQQLHVLAKGDAVTSQGSNRNNNSRELCLSMWKTTQRSRIRASVHVAPLSSKQSDTFNNRSAIPHECVMTPI
jgi:hypothetical protein